MGNAISNAIYNIYRETKQNTTRTPPPTTPCPRCGATMQLQIIGDGRMGQWNCTRCKLKQIVRIQ